MKKFYLFVGARPNFMKAAPLCWRLDELGIDYEIYHSGQHYDENLSQIFHKQFKFDKIKSMNCDISGNSIHNIQEILSKSKKILRENHENVRCVIVFGDVLTTYAVSLAARMLDLKIAHVEAGLRSFDIGMPEELIRIVVDHISDFAFSPSIDAIDNLKNEGKVENCFMVGNIMIDCLIHCIHKIDAAEHGLLILKDYVIATFHRPENIENEINLSNICYELLLLAEKYQVIFPIHPKTKQNLIKYGLFQRLCGHNITVICPLGYFEFMKLVIGAQALITDSGGIQEETTYLNIPCFTVRKNTERPITITHGSNKLIRIEDINAEVSNIDVNKKDHGAPHLWDGNTADRIIKILNQLT